MPHGHGLTDFLYQRDERLLLLRSLTGGGRVGFVVCGAGGRYTYTFAASLVSKERALGHSNLVIALTHSLPTRKREQMNPDEIKIDHCYLMRPIHGRRVLVRVTKLLNMTTRMAASEDVQPGGTESLTMKPIMVRFVWRHAAYPTGWSASQQQLPLDTFALAAEEDVACS
jgi:hypothetical protein